MAINEENLIPVLSKDDIVREWGLYNTPDYHLLVEHGVAEEFMEDPRAAINPLGVFNRYYKVYPGDESSGILNYIFIVRPDLNMDYCVRMDPYFRNIWYQDPKIIMSLTQSLGETLSKSPSAGIFPSHHLIPWLVPRVTAYSVPDISLKTYDYEQPFTNYHTGYGGNMNDSLSGAQIDVQFRDTRRMHITRLFDAWVRYINGIDTGIYVPKLKYTTSRITDGSVILDYATSIYQIGVLADGREIVYFHKTTGLFPTTVPLSVNNHSGTPSTDNIISIQFSGGYPECFDPAIFADFNYNVGLKNRNGITIEANYSAPIVGVPFITWNVQTKKYYLRWSTIQ